MPIPSKSRDSLSWVARVLARYHQFRKFIRWRQTKGGGNEVCPFEAEVLAMPRYHYDASLLFRRMILLQIDRRELARDEPLLLRELQGLCTLCGSKPSACGIRIGNARPANHKTGANTVRIRRRSMRSARCKTARGPRFISRLHGSARNPELLPAGRCACRVDDERCPCGKRMSRAVFGAKRGQRCSPYLPSSAAAG